MRAHSGRDVHQPVHSMPGNGGGSALPAGPPPGDQCRLPRVCAGTATLAALAGEASCSPTNPICNTGSPICVLGPGAPANSPVVHVSWFAARAYAKLESSNAFLPWPNGSWPRAPTPPTPWRASSPGTDARCAAPCPRRLHGFTNAQGVWDSARPGLGVGERLQHRLGHRRIARRRRPGTQSVLRQRRAGRFLLSRITPRSCAMPSAAV
jgi:hypothetical protein